MASLDLIYFGGIMKKVILIAFYFNQVNEIASKLLRGLAEYLPFFGYEPIVIVPDLGFTPSENEDLDARIITTEYEDMFSHYKSKLPFKNSSISNDGDSNHAAESAASNPSDSNIKLRDSSSVGNPIVSKAISLAGEVFAYPDGMKYWHGPAFKAACDIIEKEEIAGIISSSWPITCHTIAKDLKRKYGIPWIADLRDLWNLNPYVSHTAIRTRFERNLEMKTFEDVDVLTVTTDLAAQTLATLHPDKKIVSILSGYSKEDFRVIDEVLNKSKSSDLDENYNHGSLDDSDALEDNRNRGSLDDNHNLGSSKVTDSFGDSHENTKLKFIYAGSLYSGKRDPTLLFKAIRELDDENRIDSSKLDISFYGDSGNLLDIAGKYGLSNILNIGGKVPHKTVLEREAQSDVLLLISWNSPNEQMFIPGKIYEYFALAKPVLSIGYKSGSLKDLIDKTGIGYHVANLEDTKDALLKFYDEFMEKGAVELNSNLNIEEYSMETMAGKFARLLDDLA